MIARGGDPPIACDLSASERARRADELLPGLVRDAEEERPVPGGFRWRFAPRVDVLQRMARVIDTERRCCRFLRFRIEVEAADGPIWLEVTGPEGAPDFLRKLVRQ